MRNIDDGEKKEEKIGENSGPLTTLPVNHLKGDRLQHRRSCQFFSHEDCPHLIPYSLKTEVPMSYIRYINKLEIVA